MLRPQFLELDRGQVAKRTVKTIMTLFVTPVLEDDLGLEQ